MKEFTSQTGGRYTYVDDIINLQELSLAFGSLFDGCGNFIISGCQVSGNTLSAGFVFLNGKIRYCNGSSNITQWPAYIYEQNAYEQVSYVDAGEKVGRNVYGCTVGSTVPSSPAAITDLPPQSISISSDGTARRLGEAFFGKYALLLNPTGDSQNVAKQVVFNEVTANYMMAKAVNLMQGTNTARVSVGDSGELIVQVAAGNHKLVITKDGVFNFYSNGTLICTMLNNGVGFRVGCTCVSVQGGNILLKDNDIYNNSVSANGVVRINMLGYNGGKSYYRDFVVGDGKGTEILNIAGEQKQAVLTASLTVTSTVNYPLAIKHRTKAKSDKTLQSSIVWKDKDDATMGYFGYASASDTTLYLHNDIGDVQILNSVNIAGTLSINGVNIASLFVNTLTFSTELNKKANADNVYSIASANATFVKKTDGLQIFVDQAGGGTVGQTACRKVLDAIGTAEFADASLKSKLFLDIVTEGLPESTAPEYAQKLEERKRALCANIGAAYKTDTQMALKDSGWLTIASGTGMLLRVRQIGNIVSVQGRVRARTSGTLFTIPSTIDAPNNAIGFTSVSLDGTHHCVINSGSRICNVSYYKKGESGNPSWIDVLITYIV